VKTIVTGANGFLGSWLCKRFLQEGHDVSALVRKNSDLTELQSQKINLIYGDVTDYQSLAVAFKGFDYVIHAAGVVGYSKSLRQIMQQVNVQGTSNVVRACHQNQVSRLLHISSVVAIGAGFTENEIMDEDSKYNLSDLDLGYFETKRMAEEIILNAVAEKKIDAVMVNPSTMYGAADAKKGSRKNQIKVAQGRLRVYTHGGVNVVSVKDAVDGVVSALKVGRNGQRYILAGNNLTIQQLFAKIADCAGVKAPNSEFPTWLLRSLGSVGDTMMSVGLKFPFNRESAYAATMFHWFKNKKAMDELGFHPQHSDIAIEQSVRWMKDNGYLSK
jgi:dihydroflavonol-4-reductase